MPNLPAKLLKRVLGWIKGENRDYSKSWLQERKELKAAGIAKPGVFGLSLEHVRNAAGWAGAAMLGGGVGASTNNHSHHPVTYLFWYGRAGLFVLAAIFLTSVIERRKPEPWRAGPTVKYGDWEVTGSTTETTKDILEAFGSSGLVETPEGPRSTEKSTPTEASAPTMAGEASPSADT